MGPTLKLYSIYHSKLLTFPSILEVHPMAEVILVNMSLMNAA